VTLATVMLWSQMAALQDKDFLVSIERRQLWQLALSCQQFELECNLWGRFSFVV
jgi:hypothetical protein